jgi:pyruvate/2-oxoglutarate dehydrogenase complex dihydrolipoamide acyltransferase (E2) component
VLVTEVRERPWVDGGQVVSRPVLRLCATFDHRVIDGYQAGLLSRSMHELLAQPEQLDD